MPIELPCSGCGRTLRLADEHAGKVGKCPECGHMFTIPEADQTASSDLKRPMPSELNRPFSSPAPSAPQATSAPLKPGNLFGESQGAKPNPFADAVNNNAPLNPYAAPQTTSPFNPYPAENSSLTTANVLGAISLITGIMGGCCCLGGLISIPMGIAGLIICYQLPPRVRIAPLIMNLLGILIPFAGITVQLLIRLR